MSCFSVIFTAWMQMFIPWKDVNSNAIDFTTQIAQQTKNFGCYLWSKYPKNFVLFQNAPSKAIQFWWNSLCSEPPLNQPPTLPSSPPFTGGQCSFNYWVYISTRQYNSTNCQKIYENPYQQIGPFLGPIRGIQAENIRTVYSECLNIDIKRVDYYLYYNGGLSKYLVSDNSNVMYDHEVRIVNVSPTSGAPDNCGSLPDSFPDNPAPNPGQENTNITINVDGDNSSFSFPLIWNDIDFKIPMTFDFEVGKIDINFDGININFDKNNSWKLNNNNHDGNNTITTLYEEFEQLYNEFQVTLLPPPLEDLDKEEEDDKEEDEETSADIVAIQVEVTSPPIDRMIILADNPSDNTFFAGYFAWMLNGYRGTEMPIRKLKNTFIKPSWADGYRVFTLNQAKVKITKYTKPLTPEN